MIYFIGNKVNFDEIENATLDDLRNFLKNKDCIGFDTETEGFDPYTCKLLIYQFGNEEHQYVVDALLYPIELIYDDIKDKELIIHNAKFDLKFLFHQRLWHRRVWDTYLAECVLNKGDKSVYKSLEAVVNRYFNYHLNKSVRGLIFREGFTKRVIHYCAEDVEYLNRTKMIQYHHLQDKDLLVSIALENRFVIVLTYIEYCGIYIDVNMWKKKVEQDRENVYRSIKELEQWILDNNIDTFIDNQLSLFSTERKTTIDWSSPQQIVKLFKKLGFDTQVRDDKTGEMKDSVEARIIEKQKGISTIAPIYLLYKKREKIVNTYGEAVLRKVNPITGRIHTQFTQIMDTGRLSSGGKLGDVETINLQNIPRLPDPKERELNKIYERDCFVAPPNRVLIDADYSGQEQIVFANWCLDPDILDFYRKDLGDMHSFIASKIFPELRNLPLKEIKANHKEKRQIAKSVGFALNYGGNGSTISDNLNLPPEEGDALYKAYFDAFKGVKNYFKRVADDALAKGYILFNTISSSKCFVQFYPKYKALEETVRAEGFWDKYREEKAKNSLVFRNKLKPIASRYFKLRGEITRMSLNYPIQGSSAEITKIAAIKIFDYLYDNNLLMNILFSNVIHDEILLESPKEKGQDMKEVVEKCMAEAGDIYCKVVKLKAEAILCEFWNH